jgi:hypothetical protein
MRWLSFPIALAIALSALGSASAHADGAVRRQLDLPTNSLLDAQALGAGNLRFAVGAGFPYVQAQAGVGASSRLDVDFEVDSLYGAATQLGLGPKLRLFGDSSFALALRLRGQWTAFRNPAFDETSKSARHITGLRNWGIEPALVLSARGRAGSIFGIARYQETYATEPDLGGPLSGPGPRWGANLGFYLGGELNNASLVHLYGLVGVDLHLRSGDAPAMPRAELGITFPG